MNIGSVYKNLKSKIRLPFFLNAVKNILSPRAAVGLVVVIVLATVVSMQYKLKERIFKKPAPKKAALQQEGKAPQEAILVKVYKTQKKDFDDNLPLLGTAKGFKEIDLKFEASGVVDSFNFKEGERVEEGEIIATIGQKDALLKLRYNELEMEKSQKLFDVGAINKYKFEQSKLELESAKRELEKTYIYAARSGVLGTKDVEAGEYITPNDKVGTLIDYKEVFIELGIVERDIGKVKVGQKGKVTCDTYPDTEFEGVINSVSPIVEGKSRTQTAKLKLKNPRGQILPGMFIRALVSVYSSKDVIVIPNAAIDKTEEGYVTYVVNKAKTASEKETAQEMKQKTSEDTEREKAADEAVEEKGVAEARPIKSDYRSADFFVVKEGLEDGELVVVETQEKLKDGNEVIIAETQEAAF